jgi:hypothetical protein
MKWERGMRDYLCKATTRRERGDTRGLRSVEPQGRYLAPKCYHHVNSTLRGTNGPYRHSPRLSHFMEHFATHALLQRSYPCLSEPLFHIDGIEPGSRLSELPVGSPICARFSPRASHKSMSSVHLVAYSPNSMGTCGDFTGKSTGEIGDRCAYHDTIRYCMIDRPRPYSGGICPWQRAVHW